LHSTKMRAAIVVNDGGYAIGLIEAENLTSGLQIATQTGVSAGSMMQGASALCDIGTPLHTAVAQMRRNGCRALGLVTPDGRPGAVLTLEAALSPLLAPVTCRVNEGALLDARLQADFTAALLNDGQDAVGIQRALVAQNDETTADVAEQTIAAMGQDGWGQPPVDFAVIVMGSSGRRESFLQPDQDNGLILGAYPDEAHTAIDAYFMEFSGRFTAALDAAGFPLCSGNVMATNPVWRKTLDQWIAQVNRWAWHRSGQAVLSADIFFDFRPVYGNTELATRLHESVIGIAAANPAFVHQICQQEARETAPISLFGNIIPDDEDNQIDLKLRGTLPFVGLVRFMALRRGIAAIGTLDRLAALAAADAISPALHADLVEDFSALTDVRLRRQLADHAAGMPVGNRLNLGGLTGRNRARLLQVFRTIELLRKVAVQSYGGQRG
jgi:CBS domain-containing protein